MEKKRLKAKTVIVSDLHLGTSHSKAVEVAHFLRNVRCEKLILNGDIIDAWQLRKGTTWTAAHTRVIRIILKKMEKQGTEIIYLRGNHDDVLAKLLPFTFGGLRLVEDHVHETAHGRYLVLHGDIFDTVTKNFVFLSHLGDWGYQALLSINRVYNYWRVWRGKEYWSLSQAIKARVKSAVSHISNFEDHIAALAKKRNCTGVICGHIHTPADKQLEGIHYLNSGDWVESLTAIIEDYEGNFQLIDYNQFLVDFPRLESAEEASLEYEAQEAL